MKEEMTWTWPISSYIFLGGLGAGIAIVSAVADIFFGIGAIFAMGPFIAAVIIILASGLLVFDLGRPLRFWRVMVTKKLSEMTFGAWMLTLLMVAGLVYSSCWLTLLPWHGLEGLRQAFAWICLILGIGVALYTGIFLGTMKSRPFWNGPALPALFLLLSLSNGLAAQILIVNIWPWGGNTSQIADITPFLAAVNIGFLVLEGIILLVYVFIMRTSVTIRASNAAASWLNGNKALIFWVGAVAAGILVPILLYSLRVPATVIAAASFVLAGGAILRFLVVYTQDRIMLPGEEEFRYWLPKGDERFLSSWKD
jgi:formate-dependent nitrite reductase membrane component NrfD